MVRYRAQNIMVININSKKQCLKINFIDSSPSNQLSISKPEFLFYAVAYLRT